MKRAQENPAISRSSAPRLGRARTYLSVIIKEKRKEAGLTQHMMGQLTGVSLKAIRQIEQGEEDHVNVGALKRILAYFALSLSAVENTSLSTHTNRIIPRDELIEKLKSIRTAITKPYGIQRVRLFGSYAREEARDDSDVDILLTHSRPLSFKEIVQLEKIFEAVLGNKKTDIVMENEMEPNVMLTAEKDFIDV